MYRLFLALTVGVIACDHPIIAVPTHATATKTLIVCWRDPDSGDDASDRPLMMALKAQLISSGYHVVTKGVCEIDIGYKTHARGQRNEGDDSFRDITITVRGDNNIPVDVIHLEYASGEVPADNLDRVAILMVNAINASAKLADYAKAHPTLEE